MLLLIILLPLITTLLVKLINKKSVIGVITILTNSILFIFALIIAKKVATNGGYGLGDIFYIDSLAALVLLIITTIGLTTAIYSVDYLNSESKKKIIGFSRVKQFFILFNLFVFAMLFACATTSPMLMWISIEVTTLSSAFLISFYNKPSSIEGAWKYLIINSVGLLMGFFGTLLFFTSSPSAAHDFINWQTLISNASHLNPMIAMVAFAFVFIGYGTKVGFVPMHTWKPDAYSKSPAPVGALFAGPLMCVALLAIFRYKIIVDAAIGNIFTQRFFIFFGVVSIIVAATIIFTQKNYKRMFAYSSVEQAGMIALGVGYGGYATFAAILLMIYHSLVKASIFYSTGNLLLKFGSAKINNIKGTLVVLPITSIIFILGFLIVSGVPPFGIFLTEFYILASGIKDHLIFSIIVMVALILVFSGMLRHVSAMVFGEPPRDIKKGEPSILTVIPPIALLSILLIIGIFLPEPLKNLINNAANLING